MSKEDLWKKYSGIDNWYYTEYIANPDKFPGDRSKYALKKIKNLDENIKKIFEKIYWECNRNCKKRRSKTINKKDIIKGLSKLDNLDKNELIQFSKTNKIPKPTILRKIFCYPNIRKNALQYLYDYLTEFSKINRQYFKKQLKKMIEKAKYCLSMKEIKDIGKKLF